MHDIRRFMPAVTPLTETPVGTLPKLYHGSKLRFRKGFVLLPQSDGYTTWDEVRLHEAFIDRYRPARCLARSRSVFMVDDPKLAEIAGGYEDYVYEVNPQGTVEKNDLKWYSELDELDGYSVDEQKQLDLNAPDLIAAANHYWAGLPHPGPSLWEYRSASAVVVRRIRLLPTNRGG